MGFTAPAHPIHRIVSTLRASGAARVSPEAGRHARSCQWTSIPCSSCSS